MTQHFPRAAACLLLLAFLPACSEKPSNRFDVWGTVTFKGQPVPAGLIAINPDLSKGNDGPQGMAEIRDGRYDTRLLDTGAPSGAVVLLIDGFDSAPTPDAPSKPLFVGYKLSLDLPKEPTEKNIEVPDSAAAKANAAPIALP
jgi:hypothetical protein